MPRSSFRDRDSEQPSEMHVKRNVGLVSYDRSGRLVQLSNFSFKPWGSIKHNQLQLMGNIFAIKLHQSGNKLQFIFCPKNQVMKPDQFLEKVCFQTDAEVWLDLDKAQGFRKQWSSFMKEELRTLQENPRQLKFATMNGVNMDTIDYTDRSTEFWSFGPNTILDSCGKMTIKSPVFFFLHLFQKLSDGAGSLLREIKTIPGGRDLVAGLIRHFPPNNFFSYQYCLACAISALHGGLIRSLTESQFAMLVMKSCDGGTSYGKSSTGRAMLWLGSCPKEGKVKPTLRIQTIMKIWARTTLFLFFDDIRDPNLMCNILESAFDENMVYATSKAEYVPRAESIAAANYLNHRVVEDRYADRLKVVNFNPVKDDSKSWEELTASGVAASSYVSQETQPWEYTIGEMGDFLRSPEFQQSRDHYIERLYENASVIKLRTIKTNYATDYAIVEKMYSVFSGVWDELGYTWEDFLSWSERFHIPAMQVVHVESDQAENMTRRFILGLCELLLPMELQTRRQMVRVLKSVKIGWALGFHPDSRYRHQFKELNGASLDFVKQNLETLGGMVDNRQVKGNRVTINLIKDAEGLPEDFIEYDSMSCWTYNKTGMLFPLKMFTSFMWQQVCKMTEQFDMASLKASDCTSGVPPCEASSMTAGGVGNSTGQCQGTPQLALNITAINPPNNELQESSIFGSTKTDGGGFDELDDLEEVEGAGALPATTTRRLSDFSDLSDLDLSDLSELERPHTSLPHQKAAQKTATEKTAAEKLTKKTYAQKATKKTAAEKAAKKTAAEKTESDTDSDYEDSEKPCEKTAAEKAVKTAAEKKAKKTTAEKTAAELAKKTDAEKLAKKTAAQKAIEKTAAEKTAAEKLAKKAAAEKLAKTKKTAAQKAAEKTAAQKAAKKTAAKKTDSDSDSEKASEKTAAEKAAAPKAAKETAAEKASKETTGEKTSPEKTVAKKTAAEKVAEKMSKPKFIMSDMDSEDSDSTEDTTAEKTAAEKAAKKTAAEKAAKKTATEKTDNTDSDSEDTESAEKIARKTNSEKSVAENTDSSTDSDSEALELQENTAAEITAAEKIAKKTDSEKTAENTTAEKTATDEIASKNTSTEKTIAKKTAAEKAGKKTSVAKAAKKTATEKTAKKTAAVIAAEKTAAEQAAKKTAAQKTVTEKTAAEKTDSIADSDSDSLTLIMELQENAAAETDAEKTDAEKIAEVVGARPKVGIMIRGGIVKTLSTTAPPTVGDTLDRHLEGYSNKEGQLRYRCTYCKRDDFKSFNKHKCGRPSVANRSNLVGNTTGLTRVSSTSEDWLSTSTSLPK